MSFLSGLLPGMGDKKSTTTTTQTDGRVVTDQSGGIHGSTINYYFGAGASGDAAKSMIANPVQMAYPDSATAAGMNNSGLSSGGSPIPPWMVLAGGALLVGVMALRR